MSPFVSFWSDKKAPSGVCTHITSYKEFYKSFTAGFLHARLERGAVRTCLFEGAGMLREELSP